MFLSSSFSPSTCTTYEKLNPAPGDVAEANWLSVSLALQSFVRRARAQADAVALGQVYAPPILSRLSKKLPGVNFTATDVPK